MELIASESFDIFLRATSLWILIALLEMLHGILRAKFLAPRVGDLRSRQIGVFSGSMLFFLLTWFLFSFLQVIDGFQALLIGVYWLILMIGFEFLVGHFVFKFSVKWLLQDFNLFKGRLLAIGMILLSLTPWLVWKLKTA